MHMRKYPFLIILLISLNLSAQENRLDSLKSKQLDEIVVIADNQHTSTQGATYIPNSKQKNAAQSGIMLVGLMAIPQLDVDLSSLSVKTMAGQSVTIFIDYSEANQQDLDGLRTQDVKRVEYYSFPTDPRFKGAKYAINFIMQKYEYGGYVKIKADKQFCVNGTDASVYSKLAYKSMLFDIYADESYLTTSHNGTEKSEIFRFPNLFDNGAADICRISSTAESRFRNNVNNMAARALYSSQKAQISNRVSLNISSTPVNNATDYVTYQPQIFDNEMSTQTTSSKNITAAYTGDFFFNFTSKTSLQAGLTYNYGHNTSRSHYATTDNFSIENNAVENVHDLHFNPRFSYQLNRHNRLMAFGSGVWRHNAIDYTGNSVSTQTYNVQAYFLGVHYDYMAEKIQAGGEIGWAWERNRISGVATADNFPQINVYANYMPVQKHLLTFSWNYGKDVPDASQKSANMLQQDELMWFTGSPGLKDYKYMNTSLSYTWLPNNKWQFSATGASFNFSDRCVSVYSPDAPDGTMLRKYINGGDYDAYMFNINATAKFYDGRLILSLIPQYWIYRTRGAYSYSLEDFNGRIQASYYLKSLYFIGSYSMKRKYPATQAEYRETVPDQYQLQIGWGNVTWNISATAYSFFRKSWLSGTRTLSSEFYDYTTSIFSKAAHMRFSLSATYSFGYGKKVDRYNEVEKGKFSNSAILK